MSRVNGSHLDAFQADIQLLGGELRQGCLDPLTVLDFTCQDGDCAISIYSDPGNARSGILKQG